MQTDPGTTPADIADLPACIRRVLDHLGNAASELRMVAGALYDGAGMADARAIVAEVQAIKMALLPQEQVLDIAGIVAAQFDVPVKQILGERRDRATSLARHVTMFVAFRRGNSFSDIARALGVDHTSVRHGVMRIHSEMAKQGVGA